MLRRSSGRGAPCQKVFSGQYQIQPQRRERNGYDRSSRATRMCGLASTCRLPRHRGRPRSLIINILPEGGGLPPQLYRLLTGQVLRSTTSTHVPEPQTATPEPGQVPGSKSRIAPAGRTPDSDIYIQAAGAVPTTPIYQLLAGHVPPSDTSSPREAGPGV